MTQGVLINVCGPARSGSTMLDLMLGNSPEAFSCGEVYAWFRPFDEHHEAIECACGQRPCPVWEQIKDLPEERFHRGVVDTLGVDVVVDSSKAMSWVADANRWGRESEMRVENVLLWKNPMNLAYSWWKRGWLRDVEGPAPEGPHKSLGLETFYLYYEEFFESDLPYVSLKYEGLARSPGQELARLSKSLDLPYRKGQHRFWEKTHHYLFGSGTVRSGLKRDSTVIAKQDLPEDYIKAARGFAKELKNSERAQNVIRTLKRNDVRKRIRSEAA